MNAIDINIQLSQESKLGKQENGTLYEPYLKTWFHGNILTNVSWIF